MAGAGTPLERMAIAFELFDLAIDMIQARIRRETPEATEEEIDLAIDRWLRTRPGAEHGDGEGRPVRWPRGG